MKANVPCYHLYLQPAYAKLPLCTATSSYHSLCSLYYYDHNDHKNKVIICIKN